MQLKILFFGVLFLLCFSCAQPPLTSLDSDPLPKLYISKKTKESPLIDGLEDTLWDKASWTDLFIDIEGDRNPKYETRVKMLWNDRALYILAQMEEPHIWGNLKQRDTVLFYNNDFEVFIDPNGDTHDYMELEINALNTVWDLFLNKPYLNKNKVDNQWDIVELQSAVSYNGTLNDPTDVDQGWTLEIALPWKSLVRGNKGDIIPSNQFWRINFSRVNWDFSLKNGKYRRKKDLNGEYLTEYNWVWSPQWAINMHLPEFWGFVYFSDEETAPDVTHPKEAALILWMYRNFRKQQALEKNETYMSETPKALFENEEVVFEKKIFNDTVFWETFNPHDKKIYKIRVDGKLTSTE